jgi:hypothetical protein
LPGRHLPDESAVTTQGDCARLQEHEGLSRGCPRVADQGLPDDQPQFVRSLRGQGHSCGDPGCARDGRSQERSYQERSTYRLPREEPAEVVPRGQIAAPIIIYHDHGGRIQRWRATDPSGQTNVVVAGLLGWQRPGTPSSRASPR